MGLMPNFDPPKSHLHGDTVSVLSLAEFQLGIQYNSV